MYSCSWQLNNDEEHIVVGVRETIFLLAWLLRAHADAIGITVRDCSTGEVVREWMYRSRE
jgi:hypothetical protein